MDVPENPSADKFGPPRGQERFEAPKPRRGPQWFALVVFIALIAARSMLDHVHTTGWMAVLVAIAMFVLAIVDFMPKRSRRDESHPNDPFTPTPNVPR